MHIDHDTASDAFVEALGSLLVAVRQLTDAATYWQGPVPTNDAGADALASVLFVRRVASAYRTPSGLITTSRPPREGSSVLSRDLLPPRCRSSNERSAAATTWPHGRAKSPCTYLDLTAAVDLTPPASSALALARQTIESLAGGRLPAHWPDDRVALVGTGRLQLDDGERKEAGAVAEHLPVLS